MRAFAVRFCGTLVLFCAGAAVAASMAGMGLGSFDASWRVVLIGVVAMALLFAGIAHVADQLSWDPNTFGHDERTWRQLLGLDREQNRRLRQERRFGNSAVAGFIHIGFATYWVFAGWVIGAAGYFLVAAGFGWIGTALVWGGVKRWRAGGEFNLPGTAGPVTREPPKESRGD